MIINPQKILNHFILISLIKSVSSILSPPTPTLSQPDF